MIKVLEVLGRRPIGGVGKFLQNNYLMMDKSRISMDIIFHEYLEENEFEVFFKNFGSKIVILPRLCLKNFNKIVNEIKGLKDFFKQYDVIHFHSPNLFFLYHNVLKNLNIIVIQHIHNPYSSSVWYKKIVNNFLERKAYRTANYIIGCSTYALDTRLGKKKYKNKRSVILNTISLNDFYYDYKNRIEIRNKLGLDDANRLIINVGNLNYQKNQKFLLKLFSHLDQSKYRLIILGEGKLNPLLLKEIEQLHIPKQNIFFVGRVKNVAEYLSASDVYVSTSKFEGFGISIVEAEANGLPVISSKNVPNDVFINDNTVRLDFNNLDEWILQIQKLERINEINPRILSFDSLNSHFLYDFYENIVNHRKN